VHITTTFWQKVHLSVLDNPWISSISTRIYPPSMDIYPDASMVVPMLAIVVMGDEE
jgi:hypothetical protein